MKPPSPPSGRAHALATMLACSALVTASLWGGSLNDRVVLALDYGSVITPYGLPLAAALSGLALCAAWWVSPPRLRVTAAGAAFVTLVICGLIASRATLDPAAARASVMILLSSFALGAAAARIASRPGGALALIAASVCSGAILSAMGLAEYAEHARTGDTAWRVFSTFVMPNFLAGYLVMAIPLATGLFLAARSPLLACFAALAVALELAALLLTGSRFALAALVFALVAFFPLALRAGALRGPSRRRVAGLLALGAIASIIGFRPIANRLFVVHSESYSGRFRTLTWRGAAGMAAANPAFGTGLGSFPTAYPRYAIAGFTEHAHNSYLQLAAEAGFPALLALVIGLAAALASAVHMVWRRAAAVGGPAAKPSESPDAADARLMMAGAAAALSGAVVRSLGDSDLYVAAIALTAATLCGIALAARGEASRPADSRLAWVFRAAALVVTAFLVWRGAQVVGGRASALNAQLALAQRDAAGAQTAFAAAAEADPLNADYLLNRAELAAATGALPEAESLYERATQTAPIGKTWYRLGKFYMETGRPKEALHALLNARHEDPRFLPGLLLLADAFRAAGQGGLSLPIYESMIMDYRSPRGQLRALPEQVPWEYGMAFAALAERAVAAGNAQAAQPLLREANSIFAAWFALRNDIRNAVRPDIWRRVTERYAWSLEQQAAALRKLGRPAEADQVGAILRQYLSDLAAENERRAAALQQESGG